jgi:hypothetical protein
MPNDGQGELAGAAQIGFSEVSTNPLAGHAEIGG